MIEVVSNLCTEFTNPVIRAYGLHALVDSGAQLTIIDIGEDAIRETFHGVLLDSNCKPNGIGGTGTGKLYRFEHFQFGDGANKLEFDNVLIVVASIPIKGIDMLIGSSMYTGGGSYTVDTAENTITFHIPETNYNAKKLWIRNTIGQWKMIDYQEGKWVFL